MRSQIISSGQESRSKNHNFLIIGKDSHCVFVARIYPEDENFYELMSLDSSISNRRETRSTIDGERGYQLVKPGAEIKITV